MLIHEVETLVGLSKKSIRYYEKEGLLSPDRNLENGYRTYTENDVLMLKKIKFLRELDISIEQLKKLKSGDLSLESCMLDKIEKIEDVEKNYEKIRGMCKEIASSKIEFQEFDIEDYSKELNLLKKEGFVMHDFSRDRGKKIWGVVISSVVFFLFFIFIAGLVTYFQITEEEKMPMVLYVFVMGVFLFPMISVVINLITRVKEIQGGEEDEASKY